MGQIHYKWQFSIVMLVYQRVIVNRNDVTPQIDHVRNSVPRLTAAESQTRVYGGAIGQFCLLVKPRLWETIVW